MNSMKNILIFVKFETVFTVVITVHGRSMTTLVCVSVCLCVITTVKLKVLYYYCIVSHLY